MRGNLTAVILKGKQKMYTLLHMHKPPAKGIFYDGDGKAKKRTTVKITAVTVKQLKIQLIRDNGSGQKVYFFSC
jgi:hypothetical protein